MHIFRPSGRRICTVVGKDEEYWTEPDLDFCACKNYYYRSLSSGKPCYHLTSSVQFMKEQTFTLLEFEDKEYDQLVRAVIHDSIRNVLAL
jgi:predicted nucleic acid-binding Zn finger protein